MKIVDSSGWLEYFAGSKNADNYAKAVEDQKNLIVPSIIIYEVFKKILVERGENEALIVAAHMKLGQVVDLDLDIALMAGKIGKEYGLPLADSVILASAKRHNAILLTQDQDFEGISGVEYFRKV